MWIDQSKCQNSGLCEEEAPELFAIGDGFLAYVRQDGEVLDQPGGEDSQAEVPEHQGGTRRAVRQGVPCARASIFVD
ncbi:ferredoxin [Streptomyces sp. L7]